MKTTLSKIVSLLLMLAFLVSVFAVFAYADEGDPITDGEGEGSEGEGEGETVDPVTLLLYRTFDEGWDAKNGFSVAYKDNKFEVDREENDDYSYNYFLRVTALNGLDGYIEFRYGANAPVSGYSVVRFDVKIDDDTNIGNILYYRTPGGNGVGVSGTMMTISSNTLKLWNNDSMAKTLTGEWVNVAYIFDYDHTDESGNPETAVDIYMNEQYLGTQYIASGYTSMDIFRFGLPSTGTIGPDRLGANYCLDNIQIYNILSGAEKKLYDVSGRGLGTNVNPDAAKTVTIESGGMEMSATEHLEKSLCMKLNVEYMLLNNKRAPILTAADKETGKQTVFGAPVKTSDGQVMVPLLPILKYINYPVYIHSDNISYDISTGRGATYLTAGRDTATVNGERVYLSTAPAYAHDKNGNDYLCIGMDDVETLFPGYYVTYDDMGLIIICGMDEVLDRETGMDMMLELMCRFVFDITSADEIEDFGNQIYEDVKENTNNFDHPYLLADQDTFDYLRDVYEAEPGDENYNETLQNYIQRLLNSANGYYKNFSTEPDPLNDFVGMKNLPENPWNLSGNYGYDPDGGRLNEAQTYNLYLMFWGFAYQITGNLNYAKLAYEFALYTGDWEHWGPGHFLNCADGAYPYAIGLDWLYDAYVQLMKDGYYVRDDITVDFTYKTGETKTLRVIYNAPLDVNEIALRLFRNGVHWGWNDCHGVRHSRKQGIAAGFNNAANNWNAVCSSGMVLSCLALMSFDGVEDYTDPQADESRLAELGAQNYTTSLWLTGSAPVDTVHTWAEWIKLMHEEATYVAADDIWYLVANGMGQYAPDGAYIEGPGYWAYGTNSFYRMVMGIYTATGGDYGLMDCWGLDKTCYFAMNSEDSDFREFNYHDGGAGSQDTSFFNFVGFIMDDPGLIALRMNHLKTGKGVTLYDVLWWNDEYDGQMPELDLDYYTEGIDLYIARSSWDKGAMYVGMIGNENSAPHGQIDSGTFVYRNQGVRWIDELGSDNYNVFGYFNSAYRYKYYKNNAEGNNVVCVTSQQVATSANPYAIPYGQSLAGTGEMVEFYSNEFGSYSILDNADVYPNMVDSAKRGVLVTNDRKTVVIQDEISFVGITSLYWFAHTQQGVHISTDGKTVILTNTTNNVTRYCRLTLVSESSQFKFIKTGTGDDDLVLDTTYRAGASLANGGVDEHNRSSYSRIAIKGDGVLSFNVAVVIEMVDDINTEMPVGYTWTPMSEWEPVKSSNGGSEINPSDPSDRLEMPSRPSKNDLVTYAMLASTYVEQSTMFDTRLQEFYDNIRLARYVASRYDPEEYTEAMNQAKIQMNTCINLYREFRGNANVAVLQTYYTALGLIGME